MKPGERRVVVTGLGAVTPVGLDVPSTWAALLAGVSGAGPITSFDVAGFPTTFAAEVKGFDPAPYVPNRKSLKIMGKNVQFALAVSREALRDAGFDTVSDPDRSGVVMGAGIVNATLPDLAEAIQESMIDGAFDMRRFGTEGHRRLFPLTLLRHLPNMSAAHVAIAHNLRGPNNTIVTACASGLQAIGEGFRIVARGDAEMIVAGATDSRIEPLGMIGYSLLGALSRRNDAPERASRPFDRGRDGFVVGEGAASVILESIEAARARGARIYAEVAGSGSSSAAYRPTDPRPDGAGAVRAMRAALADAGLSPGDIGHINAHGTSTPMNDLAEFAAYREVFGPGLDRIPVTAVKSEIGHLGAASGAVEAVAAILALRDGVIPPTINQEDSDPACRLDLVANEKREVGNVEIVMKNAFGFGGQNASLILRKSA